MERFDKLENGADKIHFMSFPSVHDTVLYALSQMQSNGGVPTIITQ